MTDDQKPVPGDPPDTVREGQDPSTKPDVPAGAAPHTGGVASGDPQMESVPVSDQGPAGEQGSK